MAYAPPPPQVATLSGHLYNFLSQVGFPVRQFSTSYGDMDSLGSALPGEVHINRKGAKDLEGIAALYGKKRGRLSQRQIDSLRVLMHEGLHQMRYGRTPDFYDGSTIGTAGGNEEAATEAVTQDLLPIFTAKMYGNRMEGAKWRTSAYPEHVEQLRQLSTFGSGAGKFSDYKARVWRRTFLHATPEARKQMADAALAKRAEWGRETGR